MDHAQHAVESATMRFEQDYIIEQFVGLWQSLDLKERKKLAYRIVEQVDGTVHIKDRKHNIAGEIEPVGDGLLRCRWVRSVSDLKRIRDEAGVVA